MEILEDILAGEWRWGGKTELLRISKVFFGVVKSKIND